MPTEREVVHPEDGRLAVWKLEPERGKHLRCDDCTIRGAEKIITAAFVDSEGEERDGLRRQLSIGCCTCVFVSIAVLSRKPFEGGYNDITISFSYMEANRPAQPSACVSFPIGLCRHGYVYHCLCSFDRQSGGILHILLASSTLLLM